MIPTTKFLFGNLSKIAETYFSTNSNVEFSGYGPIHVSTSISFLICLLIITTSIYRLWHYNIIIYAISTFYFILMILTFSRSGTFILIISLFAVFLVYRNKANMIIPLAFIFILFYNIVIPILNSSTYGALGMRYSEVNPASRINLMVSDLRVWAENPIFGVGLGKAKYNRREEFGEIRASSHTEYTRFLSEQGLFGLFCLLILFRIFLYRIINEKSSTYLPIIIFFILFPSLYFLPSAFRTYLPAFSLGLSLLRPVQNQ